MRLVHFIGDLGPRAFAARGCVCLSRVIGDYGYNYNRLNALCSRFDPLVAPSHQIQHDKQALDAILQSHRDTMTDDALEQLTVETFIQSQHTPLSRHFHNDIDEVPVHSLARWVAILQERLGNDERVENRRGRCVP